jgi:hypothetical protein
MNRSKLSVTVASVGFAVVATSVVMAFLADHHWYVTYQIALFFERAMWWVQLAGALVAVIGSIGMSAYLTERAAVRLGITLIAIGLPLLLAGAWAIHDWTISLLLPSLVVLFDGAVLVVVGSLRRR